MLANTSIDRVIAVLRHDRGTTWRELYSTLFAFGVVCAPELEPAYEADELPPVAVVMLPGSAKHWVVKQDDLIYDPNGSIYAVDELRFRVGPANEQIKYATVER